MERRRGPVLVGVSHRPLSGHAVRQAADDAAARDLPLWLVHVEEWPGGTPRHAERGTRAESWATHLHARGEALLREAQDAALTRHPALEVRRELATGRPAHVFREAAETASRLVLDVPRYTGASSLFGPRDAADALVGHLHCPVVLVREPPPDVPADAPVVVGVDTSSSAAVAVELAFEEAYLNGVGLVAVEVRRSRDAEEPAVLEEARVEVSEVLAGHRERYPGVEVRQEVLTGDVAAMLASTSRRARCLVVGSRGRGGLRGTHLGSTGRTLIHGTHCPLIVAPAPSA